MTNAEGRPSADSSLGIGHSFVIGGGIGGAFVILDLGAAADVQYNFSRTPRLLFDDKEVRMRPLFPAAVAAAVLAAGALLAADAVLVSRPDAFPTLINPACSHCKDEAKR